MPATDRVLTFSEWRDALSDDPCRRIAEIEQRLLPSVGLAHDISAKMLVRRCWFTLANEDYAAVQELLDQLARRLAQ